MSASVSVEYFCDCEWAVCGGHCIEERITRDKSPRPLMSEWTHACEDVLQSAKEQRGKHPRSTESREELVRSAGAWLLLVQEMDELEVES